MDIYGIQVRIDNIFCAWFFENVRLLITPRWVDYMENLLQINTIFENFTNVKLWRVIWKLLLFMYSLYMPIIPSEKPSFDYGVNDFTDLPIVKHHTLCVSHLVTVVWIQLMNSLIAYDWYIHSNLRCANNRLGVFVERDIYPLKKNWHGMPIRPHWFFHIENSYRTVSYSNRAVRRQKFAM